MGPTAKFLSTLYSVLGFCWSSNASLQTCPLLGSQYPAPVGLSREPIYEAATRSIEARLKASISRFPYNETSFSIGMFSTHEAGLTYQYHHTDALLARSAQGARKLDANSIYRVGSVSKLLTVYLLLICEGDHRFNDPITQYIPQLKSIKPNLTTTALPDWDDITIG